MPCRVDDPSYDEVELRRVGEFLKELNIIPTRPKNKRDKLSAQTAQLCTALQKVEVGNYSLELQIWWRDHQITDTKRLEKELSEREIALNKLTSYERKLLGLQ